MLKANVGLSRKITREYNSTGYSVNVEGEISTPLDQPDAVVKQIQGLFVLAERALADEIDRDQGEQAQGRRDEEPRNGNGNGRAPAQAPSHNGNGNGNGNGQPEPATDKQLRYLETLAKRQGLSQVQFDNHIAQVMGQRLTLTQLTKKEAGRVIESMAQTAPANGRR